MSSDISENTPEPHDETSRSVHARRSADLHACIINLNVSSTPNVLPIPHDVAGRNQHVYQIQRNEDGRTRYRLRLGPFAKEHEATAVLTTVRVHYPQAFIAAAADDDRQKIAALNAKRVDPRVAAPDAAKAQVMAPSAEHSSPPQALLSSQHAAPAPGSTERRASVLSVLSEIKPVVANRLPSDLDSTRTMRPLTQLELAKHETSRWFVIQLSVSADTFDPDTLPHLDLFTLYKLYSVVGLEHGQLVHALRLGFFREEVAARTVSNYLENYYNKPLIKRVSEAEFERFSEQKMEARKDVGATGKHAAIVITDELIIRERKVAP